MSHLVTEDVRQELTRLDPATLDRILRPWTSPGPPLGVPVSREAAAALVQNVQLGALDRDQARQALGLGAVGDNSERRSQFEHDYVETVSMAEQVRAAVYKKIAEDQPWRCYVTDECDRQSELAEQMVESTKKLKPALDAALIARPEEQAQSFELAGEILRQTRDQAKRLASWAERDDLRALIDQVWARLEQAMVALASTVGTAVEKAVKAGARGTILGSPWVAAAIGIGAVSVIGIWAYGQLKR